MIYNKEHIRRDVAERENENYQNNNYIDRDKKEEEYIDNIPNRSQKVLNNIRYNNTHGDENDREKNRNYRKDNFQNKKHENLNNEGNEELENRFTKKNQRINKLDIQDFTKKEMNIFRQNYKENSDYLLNDSKNNFNDYNSTSYINKKSELEKITKDFKYKGLDNTKNNENLRNDISLYNDKRNPINSEFNHAFTDIVKNTNSYNYEKLIQDNSNLKSDNIIFKEEINRLNEINKCLVEENIKLKEKK